MSNIHFNFAQGIEKIAPSPANAHSLTSLPRSQQVFPDNSVYTGMQTDLQNTAWIQGSSSWDKSLQNFLTPQVSSSIILPSAMQDRLRSIRLRVDKLARQEKSLTLRALADALQDDADLQDLLHEYRSALIRA